MNLINKDVKGVVFSKNVYCQKDKVLTTAFFVLLAVLGLILMVNN